MQNEFLNEIYQSLTDNLKKLTKIADATSLSTEANGGCVDANEYGKLLRLFYKLYDKLMEFGAMVWEQDKSNELVSYYSEAVRATVSEESDLVLRLPRISKQKFLNSQFFVAETRCALEQLRQERKIPQMSEKLISVINIYRTDFNSYYVADNMNWDTKKVIDTMADYTGGGDGGLSSFCNLKSFKTDEIDAGMYIIISPNKNKKIENEIKFLHSLKW